MKIGDLVTFGINGDHVVGQEGLIIAGPWGEDRGLCQWEVFWMYCNKTGWWDEFRLEVVS